MRVVVLLVLMSRLGGAALADAPVWPGEAWGSAAPATAGIDAASLDAALAFAFEHHSNGVVVVRGGRIVAERYAGGWTKDTVRDMYSAQKAVTSTLVAIAVVRGHIPDLDSPAARWFTSWQKTPKARITVRHLLTMTSGLHSSKRSDLFEHMRARDKTAFALALPLDHPPGTRWAYGNPAYGLLIALLERATRQTRQAFAKAALFDPLGMRRSRCGLVRIPTRARWLRLTHHGLETTCRDMARFGLLALRGGRWGERQLVPAEYLKRATTEGRPDNPAYGYLWWLNRGTSHRLPYAAASIPRRLFPGCPADAFAALGARDSKIYVVPSLDLVVTRLGEDARPGSGVAPTGFDDAFLSRVCRAVRPRD